VLPPASTVAKVPAVLAGAPSGSYRLQSSPAEFLKSAGLDARIWYVPGGKRLGMQSGIRYAAYSADTTIREYLSLAVDPKYRNADLYHDLAKGLCLLVPGAPSVGMVAVIRALDWGDLELGSTPALAATWDAIAREQNELAR
jgi:hypothetical protein